MILFADKEMIPDLKRIWKECFGDSDSYIDLYFKKRFLKDNMLVYLLETEETTVVSMLSMLPAKLLLKEKEQKIRYFYAIATKPEYQGRGYSTKLLDYAVKFLKQQGEIAILVPASKSLFDFYKKRGFVKAFHLHEAVCEVKSIIGVDALELITEQITIFDITPKEYKTLRDAYFLMNGYVCWDEEAIAYAIEEAIYEGGYCKKIRYKGNEYGIIFDINVENSTLYIKEITTVSKELIQALAKYYNCSYVHAMLKVNKRKGESFELAMLSEKVIESGFGYFNLFLG